MFRRRGSKCHLIQRSQFTLISLASWRIWNDSSRRYGCTQSFLSWPTNTCMFVVVWLFINFLDIREGDDCSRRNQLRFVRRINCRFINIIISLRLRSYRFFEENSSVLLFLLLLFLLAFNGYIFGILWRQIHIYCPQSDIRRIARQTWFRGAFISVAPE